MLRLTVLGGAGEIGGNKILLEDRDCRVLLDFGISYTRRKRFFEEYLKPRTAAGLTDLLVTGVLPAVPGLYRRDLLRMADHELPMHDEPAAQAVLLSHAHLDHAGHVAFLDERIPVLCSPLCHRTLAAMHASRARDFETEIINFKPRPAFGNKGAATPRPFREVEGEFTIGGLSCHARPVDHSMLGCVAFLLSTFLRIAQETGRNLVVLPQDAFLLDRLRSLHPLVPDPRAEPILILKERKKTGTYTEQDYMTWERKVLGCAGGSSEDGKDTQTGDSGAGAYGESGVVERPGTRDTDRRTNGWSANSCLASPPALDPPAGR